MENDGKGAPGNQVKEVPVTIESEQDMEAYLEKIKAENGGEFVQLAGVKKDDEDEDDDNIQLLDDQGNPIQLADNRTEEEKLAEEKKAKEEKAKSEETPPIGKKSDKKVENKNNNEENEENEEDDKFTNMVDYMNKEFKLGLKTEELPEDMTRQQEAEVVKDLFQRAVNGAQAAVSQYSKIDEILKDEEVKDFIKAKSEGKTMKDFVAIYATSAEGLSDEQLLREETKRLYPNSTDEDIDKIIEGYKSSESYNRMVELSREGRKAREEKEKTDSIAEAKSQEAAQLKAIEDDVKKYGGFLNNVEHVYGVNLSDDMRKNILEFGTVRNGEGLTKVDEALQSDEGYLLATIGIMYLKDFMDAQSSVQTNKSKKRLVDKLFTSPEDAQSKSSGGDTSKQTQEVDASIANQF